MARFSFRDDPADSGAAGSLDDIATRYLPPLVRVIGLLLLVIGFWVGLKVIFEAWSLYDDPDQIQRIAQAIERGSNLDKSLAPSRGSDRETDVGGQIGNYESESPTQFRLSYFAAWGIAILLLLLVGRLSIAAVKTGGELVLYEFKYKKLAAKEP